MLHLLYINSAVVQATYTLTELLLLLPDSVKERTLRYQQPQDAYNFVLGRLLLQQALLEKGGAAEELEAIQYSSNQKPWLPSLNFNISHSQEWVACAFSSEQAVGLDIEVPRPLKKTHFRHCFSLKEWDEITADVGMHTFYQYWTAKEAVLKAQGLDLGHLLDMTIVDLKEVYVKLPQENQITRWQLQHFSLDNSPAYACLCAKFVKDFSINLLDVDSLF
uniref:Polyunsaturated fatty acid synthase PfaE n=1 Tax=Aureispira marina TaxID=365033 RepID=A0A089ZWZ2_9BACT|nr:polyunsaturated fatty acid synthase PfaE [Aureispira marina]